MSVLVRIQHRDGRDSLQRLLAALPPEGIEVVTDSGETRNPWRGYQRCLDDLPSGHLCILQDDVVVCPNFAPALELIASANPVTPVSLFFSKTPRRTCARAMLKNGKSRYVDNHLSDLVHVVGILWPVEKAAEFMDWASTNPRRWPHGRETTSDDAMVTRWMNHTKQHIRCTVPSLVEHPDDVDSTVNQTKKRDGDDKGRTAAYWIGDQDPLDLDWSR